MPKIAILGGSGYLASILRDLNSIKKNEFFFFSRRKNLRNDINYHSIHDNLNNLKNFDIIIHLSGPNQTQLKNNINLIKEKNQFTKKICDFCIKYKIKLIYLSSMQVYQNYGIKNISKNSKINLNNRYSKAHYTSEKIINSKFLNYKNMYTILRMGNVFGLRKYNNIKFIKNNLIHNFCYLALKNKKISIRNGSMQRTFIPSKIFEQIINFIIKKNYFKNTSINIFYKNLTLNTLAQIIRKRVKLIFNSNIETTIKNFKSNKNLSIYANENFYFSPSNIRIYGEIDQILKLIKKNLDK